MAEEWQTVSNKSNIKTIMIIIILIIGVGSVTALTLTADETIFNQIDKPEYTTYYTSITAEKAKEMIDNNMDLITVDTRGCDCDYNKGHIPTAVWQFHAPYYYESTQDLLVYCQNGSKSKTFCEALVSHTFGEIYHLEGGIDAWERVGYKTDKVE